MLLSEAIEPALRVAIVGELELVVADPTRVFLDKRGPGWYRERGLEIRVLAPLRLCVVTVNPVAPRAHSFDSAQLQQLARAAVPGVAVIDVRAGGDR